MIKSRAKRWVLGSLVVLLIPFGYYFCIIDWKGRPFCHKQIDGGMRQWMFENKTSAYPNIGGNSRDSLVAIRETMGGSMNWAESYNYVPGIQEEDPSDLVLLYVKQPTRWNWHSSFPTIFERKAWIIVPLQARQREESGLELGELSERIPLDEFRKRLRRTLDFVKTNERPNWRVVVEEHSKFLESIETLNR